MVGIGEFAAPDFDKNPVFAQPNSDFVATVLGILSKQALNA
jgi:hypothetical protein